MTRDEMFSKGDKGTPISELRQSRGWRAGRERQAEYELQLLGSKIDELAISSEAGWYALAQRRLSEQGFDGLGDGEVMASARRLVCEAVVEWGAALEAQRTQSPPVE